MTDSDIAWAAGILEGEGSFMYSETETTKMSKRRRKLRVRVSMTDLDIIMKLRNTLSPGNYIQRDERSARGFKDGYKRKDTYILEISGFKAEEVMRLILPFMGNRRAERIRECLYKWDANRRGPVIQPYQ